MGSGARFDIRLGRLFMIFWEALPSFNELHSSFKGPSGSMWVFKLAYGAPREGEGLWEPEGIPFPNQNLLGFGLIFLGDASFDGKKNYEKIKIRGSTCCWGPIDF